MRHRRRPCRRRRGYTTNPGFELQPSLVACGEASPSSSSSSPPSAATGLAWSGDPSTRTCHDLFLTVPVTPPRGCLDGLLWGLAFSQPNLNLPLSPFSWLRICLLWCVRRPATQSWLGSIWFASSSALKISSTEVLAQFGCPEAFRVQVEPPCPK